MTQLEQSFAGICETHNLRCLSVQYTRRDDIGHWFTVYAHRGEHCATGTDDTIATAIGSAIAALEAKLKTQAVALADEPLPVDVA